MLDFYHASFKYVAPDRCHLACILSQPRRFVERFSCAFQVALRSVMVLATGPAMPILNLHVAGCSPTTFLVVIELHLCVYIRCFAEPSNDQINQARVEEQRRSLRRQLLEVEESEVVGRNSLANMMVSP